MLVVGPRLEKARGRGHGGRTGRAAVVRLVARRLRRSWAACRRTSWGSPGGRQQEQASGDLDAAADRRRSRLRSSTPRARPDGRAGRPCRTSTLVSNTRSILEYLELGGDDRVLAVLPFHYVYGKSVLNTRACAGRDGGDREPLPVPERRARHARARALHRVRGVPSTYTRSCSTARTSASGRCRRCATRPGGRCDEPGDGAALVELLPRQRVYVHVRRHRGVGAAGLPAAGGARRGGRLDRPGNPERVARRPATGRHRGGVDEVGELVARGSNIMLVGGARRTCAPCFTMRTWFQWPTGSLFIVRGGVEGVAGAG